MEQRDLIRYETSWVCEKWTEEQCEAVRLKLGLEKTVGVNSEQLRKFFEPDEVEHVPGNLLLQEGINEIWNLVCGLGSPTAFNAANARLGVGDSSTAEAATQTDLQAATNKTYKAMNSTWPKLTGTGNVTANFQSDFLTADANYVWNEWVVDNGSTAAKTMNRKVASLGTKTTGTWTLTATITLS
jgi:hypothetical protein